MTIAVLQKGEAMDDLISRKDALDALKRIPYENLEITEGYGHYLRGLIDADNAIRQLPSAQLKPKTGKWIPIVPVYSACKCSECGYDSDDYQPYSTFCPECGCVMSEEEGNDEDY